MRIVYQMMVRMQQARQPHRRRRQLQQEQLQDDQVNWPSQMQWQLVIHHRIVIHQLVQRKRQHQAAIVVKDVAENRRTKIETMIRKSIVVYELVI